MSIKTITYCVLFISLFAINVAAQGLETKIKVYRPDYSGTWKLNESKSKFTSDQSQRPDKVSHLMIIEQNLPAISITIKVQNDTSNNASYTLYTDERGDDYPTLREYLSETSTSKWVNNNLVVTYVGEVDFTKRILGTKEYVLSKDGNTLTETFTPNLDSLIENEEVKQFRKMIVTYSVYDRIK